MAGAIWCGGEDISFPVPVTWPAVIGNGDLVRSGYSRCDVQANSLGTGSSESPLHFCTTNPFQGGPVTNLWWSFRVYTYGTIVVGPMLLTGLCASGVGVSTGLWITAEGAKLGLHTYNGTTVTLLAQESGATLTKDAPHRIDVQIISFGATATVRIYNDLVLAITFIGNVTQSGTVTSVDTVCLMGHAQQGIANFAAEFSEFMLTTEDTRSFPGLVTLALTGAGSTDDWTGVYSDINQISYSDAAPNSVNITAKDQQYIVNDLPAGTYTIKAVNIEARAAISSDPVITQVKLGYKSGSVAFGTGATKAPSAIFTTYDQLDIVNPVTGVAFTVAEINALQLDMQSLT